MCSACLKWTCFCFSINKEKLLSLHRNIVIVTVISYMCRRAAAQEPGGPSWIRPGPEPASGPWDGGQALNQGTGKCADCENNVVPKTCSWSSAIWGRAGGLWVSLWGNFPRSVSNALFGDSKCWFWRAIPRSENLGRILSNTITRWHKYTD